MYIMLLVVLLLFQVTIHFQTILIQIIIPNVHCYLLQIIVLLYLYALFFLGITKHVRGRSQLSTFMKAYREYARGEGTVCFFPENQHFIFHRTPHFLHTDYMCTTTQHVVNIMTLKKKSTF